eukprot:CAMPEP_0117423284 /NCGR_PEP_ID=MMETSP0758-20121206/3944_1 /TAXON_ID=63605 /ORGANISM="Percolomonas cosmopolitus, Strain AE-1 (ATCC 50343)" /LENGTH=320 /DNA_ID=CAMNT_0005206391 /DNA_START=68 /DNA_END=1030 /DNA_ORIENTATION=-
MTYSKKDFKTKVVYQEEVLDALRNNEPVVALESTIISHGMPYPQNVETAKRVEATVRKYGAVPATIAILEGRVCIGLSDEDLEVLGKRGKSVTKCSRRDLGLVIGRKGYGATTVAATMILAHRAGIKVFVTGGIGGVHYDGENTMDISADLNELGKTPLCVISAGVKSILDIGRTLEYLETQGVAVGAYQSEDFPAFFTRKSGYKPHCIFKSPQDVANTISETHKLGLRSGILCAVPVPKEYEADSEPLEEATQQALKEANSKGIKGKDITPFLLKRIAEITKGNSLDANIALVLNNAKVGAQIAAAYSKLLNKTSNVSV